MALSSKIQGGALLLGLPKSIYIKSCYVNSRQLDKSHEKNHIIWDEK